MSLRALSALALFALAACPGGDKATDTAATDTGRAAAAAPAGPTRVTELTGARDSAGGTIAFATPEAVRYDEALDGIFVSNINGSPSGQDNNGFIVWMPAGQPDSARVLVQGGKGGATLHAPKGMALTGDTLWVADLDVVRGFDKRSGKALASVSVPRALFLNDIAVGPDGALYVTDTGIRFATDGAMSHPGPDRVYRVAGRNVSTAVQFDSLIGPNGIAWDKAGSRWVVLGFAATKIVAVGNDGTVTDFATGVGQFDGIEQAADGRWLVSSWADSSIYAVPAAGGTPTKLISGVNAPADLGYDTKRNRLLVPLFNDNRVLVYEIR